MSYTHLTEDERYHIDELLREGHSQEKIAEQVNRSKGTISRELRRNAGQRGWRPRQSQLKANERLSLRGKNNVKHSSELAWEYAKEKLIKEQWSPEQISGRLKLEGKTPISHETLYQKILADKKAGGDLFTHLRCKKIRRKRYGSGTSGRGVIPNRVDIDERPDEVETREEIGHWEGDTIIGSHTGGAVIASMVERKTRFTCLVKAKNKTTTEVISSINQEMNLVSSVVSTITFDNGKEFSAHHLLTEKLGADIYFAKPYHSWERGLNENTNGLVRQYFPKRASFDNITKNDLHEVVKKLNNRPRKCLGFKTPLEVFSESYSQPPVALRI